MHPPLLLKLQICFYFYYRDNSSANQQTFNVVLPIFISYLIFIRYSEPIFYQYLFIMSANIPEIQIRKVFDKFNSLQGDLETKKTALCFFIIEELELENSVKMKELVTYRLRTTYFSTYNKLFSKLGKNKKSAQHFAVAYSGWLDGTLKIKERAEQRPNNCDVNGK